MLRGLERIAKKYRSLSIMSEQKRAEYMALSKEELVEKLVSLEASAAPNAAERREKRRKSNPETTTDNMHSIALLVAYLGFDYHGLARQESTAETIEQHIISALHSAELIPKNPTISKCGRTDAGVSAFGQVMGVHVRSNIVGRPASKEPREFNYTAMVNTFLPPDIRVLAWAKTGPDFDARFSCQSRTYKYYFARGDLDIQAMIKGCSYFVGRHNFRNFCKVTKEVSEYERTILRAEILPLDILPNNVPSMDMYVFIVEGHAFLYHQVRCMMGMLLRVGQRACTPETIQDMLQLSKCPAKPAYNMASEIPLTLWKCSYDPSVLSWDIKDEKEHSKIVRHFIERTHHYYMRGVTVASMLHSLQ
jgi:tRNA pseudouridine38/39 synthase